MIYLKYYKSKVGNARKTLRRGVNINNLVEGIKDERLRSKLLAFKPYGDLHLWDVGERASSAIEKGTTLVIVCKDDVYVGGIVGMIQDPSGAIGDLVGWSRNYKRPWRNVILLDSLRASVGCGDYGIVDFYRDSPGAERYPNNFFKLVGRSESEFRALLRRNGLVGHGGGLEEARGVSRDSAPEWLKAHIASIERLKKDRHHQERGHESLVEEFLSLLGYERYTEIKYQVGRIDVSVAIDGRPVIAIEVKRYWNLSRKDKDVVRQGYRYAQENGARYVVITNGDYYAVFDRAMGLKMDSNYIGEFQVSMIDADGLRAMGVLKRGCVVKQMTEHV